MKVKSIKSKLSDTEFEVMKVVWENTPPITSAIVMEQLGNDKHWKIATVLTLLQRLVNKGFYVLRNLVKKDYIIQLLIEMNI